MGVVRSLRATTTIPSGSGGWMRRAGRIAGSAALAVALLAASASLLPLRPELITANAGQSFNAVLHFDAAAGRPAGTRLISTFGPLGFVFSDLYLPDTFARLVALARGAGSDHLLGARLDRLRGMAIAVGRDLAAAVVRSADWPRRDLWFLTLPLLRRLRRAAGAQVTAHAAARCDRRRRSASSH